VAPRVSDNPVVQEHYAAQIGLSAAIVKAVARLGSPRPTAQAASLAQEFSQAAIALAADYYGDAREFARVTGSYQPPVIAPWSAESLQAYLDTALKTFEQQFQTDQTSFDAQVDQLVAQMALDAGSREIFEAIDNDPKPARFARVTRPGACAFCLMLAARGAVYRSEETAGFRPHTFPGLCQCDVEPVWNIHGYEPPAHIRAAQSLYSEATAGLPRGTSNTDRINAFRRAVYAERNASR
jgi:hypothetical protein